MSYCRFENTAKDLEDCLNAVRDGDTTDFSMYELSGFKKFLRLIREAKEMDEFEEFDDVLEYYEERKD